MKQQTPSSLWVSYVTHHADGGLPMHVAPRGQLLAAGAAWQLELCVDTRERLKAAQI